MTRSRRRSVVVGGGIGGLAAAAALRESCDEVVVIEKDDLAGTASSFRPGVPQSAQLHNLLSCAQRGFEALLPGFCDALEADGAGTARVAADTDVFELGQRMPLRDLGLRLMCAPRPVIEGVARRLLLERGGVTLVDRARALGLEVSQGAVAGVSIEADGKRQSVRAPLVVDASGPRALGFRWSALAGLATPPVERQRANRWYVSAPFERPPEARGRNRFSLVFPSPPGTRAGLISPLGDDRWQVSLSGCFDEEPPRDVAAMRAYAATLEAPWIADSIAAARPLGEPHLFRRRLATWRRYDLLRRPLPGLLPIGDAVACLNPLFGQGMSVAAKQAVELADLLSARWDEASLQALTRAYLSRSADACRSAWRLGEMVAAPDAPAQAAALGLDGPLAGRLLCGDPELHRRYVGVWHLVEPVAALREALAAPLAVAA